MLLESVRLGPGPVVCACAVPECPNNASARDCQQLIASLSRLTTPGENRDPAPALLVLGADELRALIDGPEKGIGCEERSPPPPPVEEDAYRPALIARVGEMAKTKPFPTRLNGLPLPFFDLHVDRSKCTLCGACKRTCPTGALTLVAEHTRRLAFSTRACIGCRTCVNRCPEGAISVDAVFLPQTLAEGTECIKMEAENICCKNCGKPVSNPFRLKKIETRMRSQGVVGSSCGSVYLCEACKRMQALFS
ncbi:hypothetical protein DSCO28_68070 [Desulfosarcina ovata subsp. sediminis]|uniref:4Fe-4S ferredoxin-type domain-containing protein n=1 Tax=Desulfosarcina ovata subsp. sediminis TaxID=885957 RepID=A0A5K8A1E4_9BACT|nr:4Fe-4S binding protein [Desulfosarcina ovata]BBO86241.1 hypothetical protein DSCO28_68070 [Desulfosarcina ovata subsp. sediminis]